MYFLAINRSKGPTHPDHVREHVAWVHDQLASTGSSLIQAGRWGSIGGMAVVRAADEAAARAFLANDPLVAAGAVELELAAFFPDATEVRYDR